MSRRLDHETTHNTNTNTNNNTNNTNNNTPAARRVLQAAGRPLRRVSRALMVSAGTTTTTSNNNNKRRRTGGYGSTANNEDNEDTPTTSTLAVQDTTRTSDDPTLRRVVGGPPPPPTTTTTLDSTRGSHRTSDAISPPGLPSTTLLRPQHRGPLLEEEAQVVTMVERVLRQAFFLLGAYLWGNAQPYMTSSAMLTVAEYLCVAWLTCLLIRLVLLYRTTTATSWNRKRRMERNEYSDEAPSSSWTNVPGQASGTHRTDNEEEEEEAERVGLLVDHVGNSNDHENLQQVTSESRDILRNDHKEQGVLQEEPGLLPARSYNDGVIHDGVIHGGDDFTTNTPSNELPSPKPEVTFPHPSLKSLFLMNGDERMIPNTDTRYKLDTEFFEGVLLILVRTQDVDEPQSAAHYFSGKQRRFEFQYQIKLKKVPRGRIYFAAELQEPVKMGMIQRAFVGAAMAFMKKMNPTFHFSLNKSTSDDGDVEIPHTAFTVEGSMDRMVTTKPGQPLPVLGGTIDEDPESIKRRKKGGRIDWNTNDTYTFALWTAYVDLLDWKCLNLPGIRPFSLSSVIGDQHVNLTLYAIPDDMSTHGKLGRTEIVNLEMTNVGHSALGPFARNWVMQNSSGPLVDAGAARRYEVDQMQSTEYEEEQEEANEIDALGEGIYVRSGDSVILQEVVTEDECIAAYMCNGGGFAVLQDRPTTTIVLEKVESPGSPRRSNAFGSARARSRLIRSGDKVLIKLIAKTMTSSEDADIKYLSIHRGWWLKWVSTVPTKNGFFRVYTHESEFDPENGQDIARATQSSYLTLGGAFWLRHQRWTRYHVGVSSQESPLYGGRMLGLYKPQSSGSGGEVRPSDDEIDDAKPDEFDTDDGAKRERKWVQPIQLKAQLAAPSGIDLRLPDIAPSTSATDPVLQSIFAGSFEVEVPAWIEMMNRTSRHRQLLYVVRFSGETLPTELQDEPLSDDDDEVIVSYSFSRLRTGDELASLIRLSQTHRREAPRGSTSIGSRGSSASDDELARSRDSADKPTTILDRARSTSSTVLDGRNPARIEDDVAIDFPNEGNQSHNASWDNSDLHPSSPSNLESSRRGKRRPKLIGQIAKSVRTGTTRTGKQVVRQSKKVGKGTVTAGKKIMTPIAKTNVRSNRPPSKEPATRKMRSSSRGSRRRSGRDHHVVVNREMRRMEEEASKRHLPLHPPKFLAGQLSASDQSCRTASHMLSQIPSEAAASRRFATELSSIVSPLKEFDSSFLQGGSTQVGVIPEDAGETLVHESLVARCLWESHWREEWCGIYTTNMVTYPPLTTKPSLELSLVDIERVRPVEVDELSPLPGLAILTVETAWKCHYMAFVGIEARELFAEQLNRAMNLCSLRAAEHVGEDSFREQTLWKARFWQGFQSSFESSLSGGQGKWAKVSSSTKMVGRMVLNNRRMVFDSEPPSGHDEDDASPSSVYRFVEDLLAASLSFSETSLRRHPQAFVDFLDATSRLRHVALGTLDLSGKGAICLFVNLYHCLLQHALLVTAKGPLHKRSCGHFMRSTSYEIGGDVFSLAELHCCIIRGKLSKAVSPKAPYVEAPRKSDAYRFYALAQTDTRVNFVLNTGDVSCPSSIPILVPSLLNSQLNDCAAKFIKSQMTYVVNRHLIVLPKLCDVYRNDMGGGDRAIVSYCMRFLDKEEREEVQSILKDEGETMIIKFQHTAQQYHVVLRLEHDDQAASVLDGQRPLDSYDTDEREE